MHEYVKHTLVRQPSFICSASCSCEASRHSEPYIVKPVLFPDCRDRERHSRRAERSAGKRDATFASTSIVEDPETALKSPVEQVQEVAQVEFKGSFSLNRFCVVSLGTLRLTFNLQAFRI